MPRIEKTVFISYRRTNAPWALAIYQNLTQHGYDVFFDFTSIASGDFERIILNNIRARAHFVVLLTPSALERCDEPGDWLRREIETALDTQRNIVPLMLEGFDFGTPVIAKHLTGRLAALSRYNALRVPADYFEEAMGRLQAQYLNVPLEAVLHPLPRAAQQEAKAQQAAASAAPAVPQQHLTAQEWFEQGIWSEDSDEQIRCYMAAIGLKPDYAEAYAGRGNARYEQGDLASAIQDYDQAIRFKPDFALAYHNRGLVRKAQGDLAGAIRDYDQAIRLKPDYANAYVGRGAARYDQGDLAGAIQDYTRSIELKHPELHGLHYDRGIARYDQGDLAGAIQDYDQAIRLKPDFAEAYYNRGFVRGAQGDLASAIQDYDQVIRLKPDFAQAYYNRGNARYEQGDLAGAIQDYTRSIELKYPELHLPYNNRGAAREGQGDLAGAIQDYDQAIRLKPDFAEARSNREHARKAQGDLAGE